MLLFIVFNAEKLQTLTKLISAVKGKMPKYVAKKKCHPKAATVTFTYGWLHFSQAKNTQVRKHAAGKGSVAITMNRSATYREIIKEGKELFFPDGSSKFGKIREMDFKLMLFAGDEIKEDGFQLESLFAAGEKLRIYLGTKKV